VNATEADCYAELQTLTPGIGASEWRDLMALPPDVFAQTMQGYRDAEWRTSPDTLAAVLAVLSVLGAITGAVSGAAGAVSAAAALRSL
jgi:hypothetical protein